MAVVVGDIESDGLLNTITKIHCATFINSETLEKVVFTPDNIKELPAYLDTVETVCFHNGRGFDLPAIKKVLGYEYKGKDLDSLLLSRILWPDLPKAGYKDDKGVYKYIKEKHSIESWGVRFKLAKPEHNDWMNYTPAMLHRNDVDTEILLKLYLTIKEYIAKLEEKDSRIKMSQVIAMEHEVLSIVEEQAANGWEFDVEYAYKLVDELSETILKTDGILEPRLPMKALPASKGPCKAFKKDGQPTLTTIKWVGAENVVNVEGDFSKVKFEKLNVSSSQQLKAYLLEFGWIPTEWNFKKDRFNKPIKGPDGKKIKTSPKVPKTVEEWDDVAKRIDNPNIGLIAERNKASHRRSTLQGWLRNVRLDHRIEASANTCGTNTARMMHRTVVNVPKAKDGVYYGHQMRACFKVKKGNVLVGCDAKALEARCLAHYMYKYSKAAADELLYGDIHTKNAGVFGCDREQAKACFYALIYGCTPSKLASMLGKPQKMAQNLYNAFWKANPAIKKAIDEAIDEYKSLGYIVSIDGRPLKIRYEHAVFNSRLQSTGSILMKISLCIMKRKMIASETPYMLVGNFHDETQTEVKAEHGEKTGAIAANSITSAGKYLKMNVLFEGDYKIGSNWAETH